MEHFRQGQWQFKIASSSLWRVTSLLSRFVPDLSLKHVQNQEQSMEKTLCRERFQKGQDLIKAGFVDPAAFGLPVRGLICQSPKD